MKFNQKWDRVFGILGDVFFGRCFWYFVFGIRYLLKNPHQFELVSTGDTEEENSGQNKQLQSNRLDAV